MTDFLANIFGDVAEFFVDLWIIQTNGKRAKKILRYLLYVFLGIVVVDLLSFIIYVIVEGQNMEKRVNTKKAIGGSVWNSGIESSIISLMGYIIVAAIALVMIQLKQKNPT